MRYWSVWLFVLPLLAVSPFSSAAQAIPVIFDTDMGNDIDDALALAMLHAFESRDEVQILAVTSTKDNPDSGPYIDLLNTFYGRPDIPIGVARSGIETGDSRYLKVPLETRLPDGTDRYARDLRHEDAPDAVAVLRRALATATDSSVVVIQVGFSTNLARLLDSPPDAVSPLGGEDLVRQKVRLLSLMAGDFNHSLPRGEYNVIRDVSSAQKLFAEWPTPLVVSGWEIGAALKYPATSIERDFDYVKDHPIPVSYRLYMTMPYDRETWDLTSVLWAVRPDDAYFALSAPGQVEVDATGITSFRRVEGGTHRYLKLGTEAQRARALEAMILLATQPPMP